jgi:N-acetylmuramoyl-L-alanine amidase
MRLYVDAGHGGKDSGAVGNGVQEKDINLKICNALVAYMKNNYDGVEILCSRVNDRYLTLSERTDKANAWGADLFLSIHCNANMSSLPNGFSSHVYKTADERTRAFQNVLHKEIVAQGTFKDFGQFKDDFHVLRESKMLAVLTENGFVSNIGDANKMKENLNIQKQVQGHAKGIAKFFGLKEKDDPIMADPKQDTVGHWAEADIKRALDLGLMSGFPDGSFQPDAPLTRGQFASVIVKVLDRKG